MRKTPSSTKVEPIQRNDSQQGNLRKTYFRLRQLKQAGTPVKVIAMSSPKKHYDFYSHQQAALQHNAKVKQKKLSNTASNFYSRFSKITNTSSIEQKVTSPSPPTPKAQMRRTFCNQRSNPENSPQKPLSGSLLFGKTSLNFHKQDILKNQNNNNYLNKYNIVKELGKGSFSTVFLAEKQSNGSVSRSLCPSPLDVHPEGASIQTLDVYLTNPAIQEGFPKLGTPQAAYSHSYNVQEKDSTSNFVAIKVYQKFKMNKDPHKFKNIKKEINIMQNLDNEGVVKLYESVQTLTKISLVVQYGGEQSLLEYVKHNYPLPLDKVRDISFQLIKAITYLHDKNIVHRDIKLQNVLIHKSTIKLIDFGFSCLTHKQQKMTVICGTPNYMAPEVISKKEYIGQQADIWSFGVVVYALAQGRHPFKAQSYNELQRTVNRGKFQFKKIKDQPFMDFVRRILKLKGADRPTAREILEMKWLREGN